jgi:hypothetical protein
LYILLGAIINIAVAWGCAFLVGTDRIVARPYYSDVDEPRWCFTVRESLGGTSVVSSRLMQVNNIPAHPIDTIGWSRVADRPDPAWQRPKYPVIDVEQRTECAAGFPFRALMGWRDHRWYAADGTAPNLSTSIVATPSDPVWAVQWQSPALPPAGWDDLARSLLPLRPIPIGFILNTMIFGAGCYFVAFHWRRFVQARRRARGCCRWCGYNAASLPTATCPECGRVMSDTTTFRDRCVLAGMRLLLCLAFGCAIAVAVAWMIAWFGDVRNGSQRIAWPQALPSTWLAQRIDAPGATMVRWAFDDEWSITLTITPNTLSAGEGETSLNRSLVRSSDSRMNAANCSRSARH